MSGTEPNSDSCGEERPAKPGEELNQSLPPASMQTHMAWLRTRMALETTLAAWIRTATSLIVFGFAIVQFFEHFRETGGQVPPGAHLARYVGLVLIGIGSLATGIAVWEYREALNYLQSGALRSVAVLPTGLRRIYPGVVVAVLLCLVGLLAFFTILVGGELPWPGRP